MSLSHAHNHRDSGSTNRMRRRITAALSIAVVAILAAAGIAMTSSPAVATAGMTASLLGDVYVPDENGVPQSAGEDEVLVSAYLLVDQDDTAVAVKQADAVTDATGQVEFEPLPAGEYAFEYAYRGGAVNVANGFLNSDAVTLDEAIVDSGSAFTQIIEDGSLSLDFTMAVGGILQGHAQSESSVALAGQPVELWRASETLEGVAWVEDAVATTNGLGDYLFDSLPSGTYTVRVGGANNYIAEFWEDRYVATAAEADSFSIQTDDVAVTKNVVLGLGGRVNGVVKNTAGQALRDVRATAYIDNGTEFLAFASALTASNGTYSISGLPEGTYKVGFSSSEFASVKYVDRYWTTATDLDNALPFTLATSATKSKVNVTMTKGGSISGTVSLAGGGFPAANDIEIRVCLQYESCMDADYSEAFGVVSYNTVTGAFSVTALPAGTFQLWVNYLGTANYLSEGYDNVRDTYNGIPLVLATGAALTGKNIQLDPGATISGQVRSGGNAVPGVRVALYDASGDAGTSGDQARRSIRTDATGAFTITGIDQGHFSVRAEPSGTLAWQWSGGAYAPLLAQVIDTVIGGTTSNVDFDLIDGGTLSGNITSSADSSEVPYSSLTISRFTIPGGDTYQPYSEYLQTDSSGHYSVSQLPPGEYAVFAEDDQYENLIPRYFGGSGLDIAEATRVTVTSGGSSIADLALDTGGAYTGRVVDENGVGVSGARLYDASSPYFRYCGTECDTDAGGYFLLNWLAPGAHEVQVSAMDNTDLVDNVDFDGPATTVNALPVNVGDIVLETGSHLTGVVVGIDGKAVKNVGVEAYVREASGRLAPAANGGSFATDSSGRFDIERMPTEDFFLKFTPPYKSPYGPQFFGGGLDWTLSDPVKVTVAGSTTFSEVRLMSGGTITGVVTNKATGARLGGIQVTAHTSQFVDGSEYWGGGAETNSKGAFAIPGLPAGGYDVTFNSHATGPSYAYGSASKTTYVTDRLSVIANAAVQPGVKLSGVVTDTLGDPHPFSELVALPAAGNTAAPLIGNYTDEKGQFTYYLPAGKWVLYASDGSGTGAPTYWGATAPGSTTFEGVTPIVLTKAPVVANVVLQTTDSAITASSITGTGDNNPHGSVLIERLVAGEPVSTQPYKSTWGWVGLGNGLQLNNVVPGDYRITIHAESDIYNSSQYFAFDELVLLGHVGDNETWDLGAIDLGTATPRGHAGPPTFAPGDEPTIQNLSSALQVGAQLAVDSGNWTPATAEFEYQWMRSGHPIRGAVSDTYLVAPGDAGSELSVRILPLSSYGDVDLGYIATLAGTVAAGDAPHAIDPPLVSGASRVGQTLTVAKGNWNLSGLTFTYQWLRDGDPIAGATAMAYKTVTLDVDAVLGVRVSATRAGFDTGISEVAVSPVQPATAMVRSVAGKVTSTVDGWTATSGTWKPASSASAPTTFSYTWLVYDNDGTPTEYPSAPGASSTFVDSGVKASTDRVTVLVTATKAGYTPTTIEVPVRLGPVPDFGIPPVDIQSTAPSGARVGWPVSVDASGSEPHPSTGVISYQWYRGTTQSGPWTAISKATSATYTPVALDTSKYLSVRLTLKAPGRAVPTAAQATVVLPTPIEAAQAFDAPDPVIEGDLSVGNTLSVDPGAWSPSPTMFAYQWFRQAGSGAPVAISGATKSTYLLTAADLHKYITVRVTGSKSGLASLAKTSITPLDSVEGVLVFEPDDLVVTGDPNVGQKLTVDPGDWTPEPTKFTYQWMRSSTSGGTFKAISGATKATYLVAASDKFLKVRVTGTKVGLVAKQQFSDELPIGPTIAAESVTPPSIGTVARVGSKLSATTGSWDLSPTSYLYQWQLNGAPIVGATLSTYTPTVTDLGEEISVAVTAKKTGYPNSQPASSDSVTVELGLAIKASKAPVLSVGGKTVKSVKSGQSLATTAGTWPIAAVALKYQWQVDRDGSGFVNLDGQTAKALLIDEFGTGYLTEDESGAPDFEVGYKYRVVVSPVRTGYEQGPDAVSSSVTLVP